jgi:hypothetical protein
MEITHQLFEAISSEILQKRESKPMERGAIDVEFLWQRLLLEAISCVFFFPISKRFGNDSIRRELSHEK